MMAYDLPDLLRVRQYYANQLQTVDAYIARDRLNQYMQRQRWIRKQFLHSPATPVVFMPHWDVRFYTKYAAMPVYYYLR